MSKEEAERLSAQTRSSSIPPREQASEPPRALPSTPPQTDDIDTDWGAEPAAAPASPPVSAAFNATAILRATSSATGTPLAAPPPPADPLPVVKRTSAPPPAAPALTPGVRPSPLRSQTLLGMPAPKLHTKPPAAASEAPPAPPAEARAPSAAPPGAAANEVSQQRSPLPTLIGIAAPPTPEPPRAVLPTPVPEQPPAALPTPVPEQPRAVVPTPVPELLSAADRARSSVPPPMPPPPPASTPPLAVPRPAREHAASTRPMAAVNEPKGSGRVVGWLAAAGLTLGVIGYVVLHRSEPQPVAADVNAAVPAAPPAPQVPAAAAPTTEPEPAAAAASAAPASASAVPAASAAPASESAVPAASAAPTSGSATAATSAAPGASTESPVPGTITVTVKSNPPKARIFHFGKQVGVTPWVVELKPGERHAYEVGLPGRVTRKLVLDGSKTQITVGLNPAP